VAPPHGVEVENAVKFRVFAPQRQHSKSIWMKFGMGVLSPARCGPDRWTGWVDEPSKNSKIGQICMVICIKYTLINVKSGVDEYTVSLLLHAKFGHDGEWGWVQEPPDLKTWSNLHLLALFTWQA